MKPAVVALALTACLVGLHAQGSGELPTFDVASIRPNPNGDQPAASRPTPNGLAYENVALYQIIINAYGLRLFQVEGMPDWAFDVRYDIEARASAPISDGQRLLMLRTLLAERFNLVARLERRERTAYVMTRLRADGALGTGLEPRADCEAVEGSCEPSGAGSRAGGFIRGQAFPIAQVQRMLSIVLEQVVVDETAIQGVFDVDLSWRPDNAGPDDPRPGLFTAVEEQLGLRLTPERRLVPLLVIEHVEPPTPN